MPLPTAPERAAFLEILGRAAEAEGLQVDAATAEELETRRLPVLPNGGLPLPEHLRWTPQGYRVEPSAAAAYELAPGSPLLARDGDRR